MHAYIQQFFTIFILNRLMSFFFLSPLISRDRFGFLQSGHV